MPDDKIIVGIGADLSGVSEVEAGAQLVGAAMARVRQATVESGLANKAYKESLAAVAEYQLKDAAATAVLQPAIDRQIAAETALAAAKTALTSTRKAAAAAAEEEAAATLEDAAAQDEDAAASVRGISARQAATAAIGELEGRTMSANRAAGAFLSTTLGLGPVLEAAFPVIGAVALVEVFRQIISSLDKMIEGIIGWGDAEKKVYLDNLKQLVDQRVEHIKLGEEMANAHALGVKGAERYRIELDAAKKANIELANVAGQLRAEQVSEQAELDSLTKGWGVWKTAAVGAFNGADDRIKFLEAHLKELGPEVEKILSDLQRFPVKQAQMQGHESGADTHEAQRKQMEAFEEEFAQQKAVHAMERDEEAQFWASKLDLAKKYPENYHAVMMKLLEYDAQVQTELKSLQKRAWEEIESIAATASKKEEEDTQQGLERYARVVEQRVKKAQEGYDRQLNAQEQYNDRDLANTEQEEQRKVNLGQETIQQSIANQQTALSAWYAKQLELATLEVQRMQQLYGVDDQHYQAAVAKKEQIDQKYAKDKEKLDDQLAQHDQVLQNKIMQTFATTGASILTGKETVTKAMMQLDEQLADNAIKNMILMLEQEILTGHSKILMDAKSAASGAYNWAAAWGGPVAGGIAAAAAFAGVMAFASFDQGTGYVPKTGLAIIHEGESVIPAPTMKEFRSMSSTSASNTFRNTFNISGPDSAQMTRQELGRMVRQAAALGTK